MSNVGRPALPANVHALRGNPSKLPLGSLLDDTVRPAVSIPTCPPHLGPDAREEWDRITVHLEKLGLITDIDRAALSAYCSAWGDYVWAERRIAELNGETKYRPAAAAGTDQAATGGAPVGAAANSKRKPRLRTLPADSTGERGRIWDTPSGYKQISVPMQIRNRAMEQMKTFLTEFGMSPAARSRVTASDPQLGLPGLEKPQEGGWGTFEKQPRPA